MVDVNIGYNPYVINTGITHDLIVGCSVFTDTVPQNFVVDLIWFVVYNMPSGADWEPVFTGPIYTGITGIPLGNYIALCRAWKSYDLNPPSPYEPATKLGDITANGTVVGAVYYGGAVYGDTIGDGNYLDQISRGFAVSGVADVAMDLTFLEINVA